MTVLDKREELMNVTGAINRVFSGDEIPENAFLGVSLHSGEYGGSWPEVGSVAALTQVSTFTSPKSTPLKAEARRLTTS